jgi:hypothetical protein
MTGATSIPCSRCGIPLLGYESKCPACRKRLLPPDWILPLAGFFIAAFVGLGILASRDLKTMLDERSSTPEEVYAVAQSFVEQQPAVRGPARFDGLADTEVERWRGHRWRVAGHAAARDVAGTPVRLLYSCVMAQQRGQWALEEIRIETIR